MLRDLVALDPCSGCLHDGGSQQGPHPLGHSQMLCHLPGRHLKPAEGIASFSTSPQQAPDLQDPASLKVLPPLCPLSGWEQIPEEPSFGCTSSTWCGESICPLHLMPSPAQEPPSVLTPWLGPPEATRHLKSCDSLQCELVPRKQWARSHQGFSADSSTHRDRNHREGRRLYNSSRDLMCLSRP